MDLTVEPTTVSSAKIPRQPPFPALGLEQTHKIQKWCMNERSAGLSVCGCAYRTVAYFHESVPPLHTCTLQSSEKACPQDVTQSVIKQTEILANVGTDTGGATLEHADTII